MTLSKDMLNAYLSISEIIDDLQHTYYDFSVNRLIELKEKQVITEKNLFELLKSGSTDERIISHLLLVISYLIHHSTECMI